MTAREALRATEKVLVAAAIGSPGVDACILLAHVLGDTLAHLPTRLSEPLTAPDQARFDALTARRARREPLAYITGETEFMGLPFRCDPRAFVPRPDTETLVEATLQALAPRAPRDAPLALADIGTGTGCIAISLAHFLPTARVHAVDCSADALALARENAALNQVAARVSFLHGEGLRPLVAAGVAGEIIALVSNPPYIPSGEIAGLEPEVSLGEPRVALDGGSDGLDYYRALLGALGPFASLELVAFEFGIDQEGPLAALVHDRLPGWHVALFDDLSALPRALVATRTAS